jgi:hypothetical protein
MMATFGMFCLTEYFSKQPCLRAHPEQVVTLWVWAILHTQPLACKGMSCRGLGVSAGTLLTRSYNCFTARYGAGSAQAPQEEIMIPNQHVGRSTSAVLVQDMYSLR